jgi:hypothetical protein
MNRRMMLGAAVLVLALAGCSAQAADPATVTVTVDGPTVTATVTETVSAPASTPGSSVAPETFTMRGEFVLRSSFTTFLDTDCMGVDDFAALKPGGSVTVYSATGDVLHVGTITAGKVDGLRCNLPWAAAGVPAGVGPYQYEVTGIGKWSASETTAAAGDLTQTLG